MPTTKPRYTITADAEIEAALQRGRRAFPPGTADSKILAALVVRGDADLERERAEAAADEDRRRRAALRLARRFSTPDGLDAEALAAASEQWLRN